jgi:cathepsin B
MFSQFTRPTLSILKSDTIEDSSNYVSLIPDPKTKLYKFIKTRADVSNLPKEFEGRKVWGKYLSDILDQKECGSCWAFAAASALSDRFNIQSLGGFHITLSPVRIILCDPQGSEFLPSKYEDVFSDSFKKFYKQIFEQYGCHGNTLSEAWRYLYVWGAPTIECIPINLEYEKEQVCTSVCINKNPIRFYNADHIYAVPGTKQDGGSEFEVRQEIYKWGPVSTAFEVYPDFYTFNPLMEIYRWNGQGERLGGHSVVIDGWGEDNGVQFWWVRNSWGKNWGIQGYFKMIRGINNCKFEENIITGSPNIQFGPLDYGSRDWQERAIDAQHKARVHDVYFFGGGIDPLTGYHRNYLVVNEELEKLDFSKFSALSPTFIAGDLQSFPEQPIRSKYTIPVIILLLFIFVLFIL